MEKMSKLGYRSQQCVIIVMTIKKNIYLTKNHKCFTDINKYIKHSIVTDYNSHTEINNLCKSYTNCFKHQSI